MSRRTVVFLLIALLVVAGLSFIAAEQWIAPGHPTAGHEKIAHDCFACHQPFQGTPTERCATCHDFTKNNGRLQPKTALLVLHREFSGQECTSCHAGHLTREVTSATPRFDHSWFFPLEGPHDTACKTCHISDGYRSYSCTGCHEHSPDRLAREHAEEGIRNLDHCVRCHRDGSEHGSERQGEREHEYE